MNNSIDDALHSLSEHLLKRELVPFCGAGISRAAGIPTVREYLQEQGEAAVSLGLRRATAYELLPYNFPDRFGGPNLRPTNQQRLLAQLNCPYVVTTNYDRLLEQAHSLLYGDDAVHVVRVPEDLYAPKRPRNVIVKLHGDVDKPETVLISSEQYLVRWRHPTRVDQFVAHLFSTHPILFVGYSLEDEHILNLLDEDRLLHKSVAGPPKYIVLQDSDRKHDDYWKRIRVKPIYLEGKADIESEVSAFLYRLWENRGDLMPFAQVQVKDPASLRELILDAVVHRQAGQTERAYALLTEIEDRDATAIELSRNDLLPTYLWLAVSTADKLERWEDLPPSLAEKALRRLEGTAAAATARALRANYSIALANAWLRAALFQRAEAELDLAAGWEPTPSADAGLYSTYANGLTIKAMLRLAQAGEPTTNKVTILKEAKGRWLRQAEEAFKVVKERAPKQETHYMGRYYGALVFIETALQTAGEPGLAPGELLDLAKLAHTGNRTGYGKVAGLYCEAWCRYWLAQRGELDPRSELDAATSCLTRALKQLGEKLRCAAYKIRLLQQRVDEMRYGSVGAATLEPPGEFGQRIARVGEDRWLALPLN